MTFKYEVTLMQIIIVFLIHISIFHLLLQHLFNNFILSIQSTYIYTSLENIFIFKSKQNNET